MFVMINGAFGIGKSTVARELRALLPGSMIFDPEWIGIALQRTAFRGVSDFQDLALWRRMTVLGARCVATPGTPVIIPMAFSRLEYLNEIRAGLAKSKRPVFHFCLTAPAEVVRQRLATRGEPAGDARWAWVHRRAMECCAVHRLPGFATQVETRDRTAAAIAASIAAAVGN